MQNVHTTTVLVSAKSTHSHKQVLDQYVRNRPSSKRKTLHDSTAPLSYVHDYKVQV